MPESVQDEPSATRQGNAPTAHSRILGLLLGGAVGDAIGARAERHPDGEPAEDAEKAGDTGAAPSAARLSVTNATLGTIFTVEGLIRAHVRGETKGICHPPSIVQHALLRWAHMQGRTLRAEITHVASEPWPDGWLSRRQEMRVPRAGGGSSFAALESVVKVGDESINDAKDCGALVRAAPFGLVADERNAFGLALEISTLTHPRPDGCYPAAAFAQVVCSVMTGASLAKGVADADARLEELPRSAGARRAVDRAADLVDLGHQDELEKELTGLRRSWGGAANEALTLAIFVAERAAQCLHSQRRMYFRPRTLSSAYTSISTSPRTVETFFSTSTSKPHS